MCGELGVGVMIVQPGCSVAVVEAEAWRAAKSSARRLSRMPGHPDGDRRGWSPKRVSGQELHSYIWILKAYFGHHELHV